MILVHIYNIIRYKKWRSLLFISAIIFLVKAYVVFVRQQHGTDYLLELNKCPVCYGTSACNFIRNVDVSSLNFWSNFNHLFGVKNVYFGMHRNTKVILKKLAHTSELDKFDEMLCANVNLKSLCWKDSKKTFIGQQISFSKLISNDINPSFEYDDIVRLRLCPTTEHLHDLFQNVYNNNKYVDKQEFNINLWTLITINPEPLMLQILPALEGWPVPMYLGACGRVVMEEYVGLSLIDHYYYPWVYRAKIAASLLNAAYMFTFQDKQFRFYLTDISPDNIAVDAKGVAKFIDLENVIVVDKNVSQYSQHAQWWNLQENSENDDCISNCLAYSSLDICNHYLSDHNYYAICHLLLDLNRKDNLFPGGLLHDVPYEILQRYSSLKYLIEQCVNPVLPNTRITSGNELKQLLDEIVQEF